MTRLQAAVVWIVLVGLAFGPLGPAEARPDELAWLVRLVSGDWAGENALVVAEFQLMGLWPLWCALLLRGHWRHRPVPAWPFLLGSMVLGCFVLLPWFMTPRDGPVALPRRSTLSGLAAAGLGLVGAGFVGWGLASGSVSGFAEAVGTESFMWAMSWDFAAFGLLFAWTAIRADARPVRWVTVVPVVGPAAYLAWHHLGPADG